MSFEEMILSDILTMPARRNELLYSCDSPDLHGCWFKLLAKKS